MVKDFVSELLVQDLSFSMWLLEFERALWGIFLQNGEWFKAISQCKVM
jgi:hypothetical protein